MEEQLDKAKEEEEMEPIDLFNVSIIGADSVWTVGLLLLVAVVAIGSIVWLVSTERAARRRFDEEQEEWKKAA